MKRENIDNHKSQTSSEDCLFTQMKVNLMLFEKIDKYQK